MMHEVVVSARRVRAIVDRAPSELATGSQCMVSLDADLMTSAGLSIGDVVTIETPLGRETVARLGAPIEADRGSRALRLDRLLRQSIKAKLNEEVKVRRITLGPATRVVLSPPIDLSDAHHLVEHLKETFVANAAPVMEGSVLFSTFHHSKAGTTYRVVHMPDGPGIITDETKLELQRPDEGHDHHVLDITFEDVGGVGPEIKLIRELIQLPLQCPHIYRHLGIQAPKGIVLYGPPGCGKTHLTRAIANEIDANFYYINGPALVGTLYGETEANLRRIFNEAAHHAPSVIFIDEIDSIAPNREHVGTQTDVRAVTQLLSLMDGLTKVEGVITIGTTNRIDALDPAMRRPGRFDREVFIDSPTAEGRLEILRIHTRDMPLSNAAADYLTTVADTTHGFVGADIMELCREAGLNALRRIQVHKHLEAFNLKPELIIVEPDDFKNAVSAIRPSAIRESFVAVPDVKWDDIGGLSAIKRELQVLIVRALKNPGEIERAGITPPRGVLLHGPSGTGKTMIAKAIANEAAVNFIAVEGPEIFGKWLGESEAAIRHIFRVARQLSPCIVFFDQLDALAPKRGADSGSRTTERVVNQLLSELDGIKALANILVIAATNRLDLVDSSVLRPGRLGTKIFIPLPNGHDRTEILRLYLKGAFEANNAAADLIQAVSTATEGFSGADLKALCDESRLRAYGDEQKLDNSYFEHVIAQMRATEQAGDDSAGRKGRS
jgi:transitional endoplasmic reticulum ATPase